MYTNGLRDRFGSPLVSQRDVNATLQSYLTKTEGDERYAPKGESGVVGKSYDWNPDWTHSIYNSGTTTYVAPINGWISTCDKSESGDILINGRKAGYNFESGSFQMLLKVGDSVTFSGVTDFIFAPCAAEQYDFRTTKTPYDIWKNAIVEVSSGSFEVRDLYVPDASQWNTTVYKANSLTITSVTDYSALNSFDFVCNIQSSEIVNGSNLMKDNVNLISWKSDLSSLTTGTNMFNGCSSLNQYKGDLESLTDGTGMFAGCSLDYNSLEYILSSLPRTTTSKTIDITVSDDAALGMGDDYRFTDTEIPAYSSGESYSFIHRGWTVNVTSQNGFTVGTVEAASPYEITRVTGYVPDASQWNTEVYKPNDLIVDKVEDGYAWTEE